MNPPALAWSPYIALALGALAGLGMLRSWLHAAAGAGIAMLAQVMTWMGVFLATEIAAHGWTQDWQGALFLGFIWGLMMALPYTVVGAVVMAGLIGLLHNWRRRRNA